MRKLHIVIFFRVDMQLNWAAPLIAEHGTIVIMVPYYTTLHLSEQNSLNLIATAIYVHEGK